MSKKQDEDKIYYFNIKDKNGFRFSIPYLNPMDGDYVDRYIEYMKLRESNPAKFEKLLSWD
ncbi:MAG: hypothetical protein DRG78_05185 [Epsilonproteobacteria bacterium]|nr:MAG: hypothetical protein DRG78_05185 [Campylobacterota bacterium]